MLPRQVSNSWAQVILPPLASQSAGITGVSHCAQPEFRFYKMKSIMEMDGGDACITL